MAGKSEIDVMVHRGVWWLPNLVRSSTVSSARPFEHFLEHCIYPFFVDH